MRRRSAGGSRVAGVALAVVVAVVVAAGCGRAAGAGPGRPAPGRGAGGGSSDSEFEALFRARQDSARLRFTEADVRFVSGMIVHHAQAIAMARLAPARTATPAIHVLAGRIINAQQDEIAIMREWLRDRGRPAPEVRVEGTEVVVSGGHAHLMPGMLTPEQMRELERARGPAFDRLFLTYMIQHHRGALAMVDELLRADGAAQDPVVFKLASDIHVDQTTEIARMEQMLAALPASGQAPR